ncbi:MAG: ArdC-like ssDNA-binding domain-containing protein [Candidatus Thiodiazotropha sp.]
MARIKDIYVHVTDKIVSELENGIRPWMQPWNAEHAAGRITRPLRHNGIPYNGINILMLWSAALDNGYAAPYWLTYKQAKDLGAQVRKGERSSLVVYANTFTRTEENAAGEQEEHKIPFLKSYSVFNAEQIDGLPEHYTALAQPVIDPIPPQRGRIGLVPVFIKLIILLGPVNNTKAPDKNGSTPSINRP